MKHILLSDATIHQNSNNCTVYEYGDNGQSDAARAVINGRYPEKNFAVNELSSMTVFVIDGRGSITTKQTTVLLSKGDVVFINKNEPYFYEGDHLDIFMSSNPAWSPDQYKEIE